MGLREVVASLRDAMFLRYDITWWIATNTAGLFYPSDLQIQDGRIQTNKIPHPGGGGSVPTMVQLLWFNFEMPRNYITGMHTHTLIHKAMRPQKSVG